MFFIKALFSGTGASKTIPRVDRRQGRLVPRGGAWDDLRPSGLGLSLCEFQSATPQAE